MLETLHQNFKLQMPARLIGVYIKDTNPEFKQL